MPLNLLILPLIAGYYLLTRSNYFKFRAQRLDRQRLIFDSILLGILLISLTFLIRLIFTSIWPASIQWLYSLFPIQTPFFGTTAFSLILALIITHVGNITLWKDRDKQINKALKSVGNQIELLLKSSFCDSKLLQFTLDTGKFYIVWVKELPIPTITNYIRVIPAFSGYRTADDKKMHFTTQYLSIYAEYVKEGKIKDIKDLDTDLIITLDNIVTVSYFDMEMYERFLKNGN